MPHLLVSGIRCPVSWNISRPWHLVITQRSCWQKEGVWLQTSNLEISHANIQSAENYLKEVLHVNSEKLETIWITHFKADLRLFEFWLTPFSGLNFSLALSLDFKFCWELLPTLSTSME